MANETQDKKEKAPPGSASTGTEGKTGGASSNGAPDGDVSLLSLEVLPVFGESLFGTHWQADLARAISLSKSQITRIIKKRDPEANPASVRNLNPKFPVELKEVVLERILSLTGLLDTPGMPYYDSIEMEKAREHILKAAQILRGEIKVRTRA